MKKHKDDKKRFSLAMRAKSLSHAARGLSVFFRTTHNAWVQLTVLAVVILAGLYFQISYLEWLLIILASGFVLAAEAFNTAIEIDVDLTSPEYHPYARDTKDVAAAAVLISAITATLVGIMLFGHHILDAAR